MTRRPSSSRLAVVATALLPIVLLLSGCVGVAEKGNRAPTAVLKVDKKSGFNGDEFRFDATESRDPDGSIAHWRIEFGDGATHETNESKDAKATHRYARGGEYVARLTVTDNGPADVGQQTRTDELTVKVNERRPMSGAVLYAPPANQAGTAQTNQTFTTTHGVDRYEANLTVRSLLVTGSTEIRLRVIDPDGKTIADRNQTVQAGQQEELRVDGNISRLGDYTIWITATSGYAELGGEIRVYYDR